MQTKIDTPLRDYIITEIRKDYYHVVIGNVNLGVFEKSDIRHLIETLDNSI